ncbi:unnamed protein product [Moneuplotes crassus]|uniref:EF-hand domain-containing protein n=1 Tax=Euplotes crassus TaxID=5936 RepID=A0AAD1Y2G7_EUPCR|nr:unnamed protein product [Moneuplotes crassus]
MDQNSKQRAKIISKQKLSLTKSMPKKQDLEKICELNKTKAKIKRTFEDLDEDKTGEISVKLFSSILHCLGIEINSRLLHQNSTNGDVKYHYMMNLLKQERDKDSGELQWKFVENLKCSAKLKNSKGTRSIDTRITAKSLAAMQTLPGDNPSTMSVRSRKSVNRLLNISKLEKQSEIASMAKNSVTMRASGKKKINLPGITKMIPDTQSKVSTDSTSRYGGSPGKICQLKRVSSGRYKNSGRKTNGSTTSSIVDLGSNASSQNSQLQGFLMQAFKISQNIDVKKALSVLKYLRNHKVPLCDYRTYKVPKFLADIHTEIQTKDSSKCLYISEQEFGKLVEQFCEIETDDAKGRVLEGLIDVLKVQDKGLSFEKFENLLELYKYLPDNPEQFDKVKDLSGSKSVIAKKKIGLKECFTIFTDKMYSKFENSASAFKFFNYSGQGFLSMDEFKTRVHKLGLKFTNSQLLSLFTSIDKNKDSYIDFSEFHRFYITSSPTQSLTLKSPSSTTKPHNRTISYPKPPSKHTFYTSKFPNDDDQIISKSLANFKKKLAKSFLQSPNSPSNANLSYTFGIKSPAPDNIKEIMDYAPLGEYMEESKKREQQFQRSIKSMEIFKKAKPTFSSRVRDLELEKQRKKRDERLLEGEIGYFRMRQMSQIAKEQTKIKRILKQRSGSQSIAQPVKEVKLSEIYKQK